MIYIEQNWDVKCLCCGSEKNLVVHHLNYEHVNEKELSDEEVQSLTLLCRGCHYKWHFQKGFVYNWTNNILNSLLYGKK